ncbi:hypothetical protein JNM87_03615 [Candidatus Saccharibacteria bacterium]|nr:hypothetical protein [Candidatus Saccharibacteria bacterium]
MFGRKRNNGITIKASCPECGDVELLPRQVRLVIWNTLEKNYYSFVCPRCFEEVCKPANEVVAEQLTSGGVIAEHYHIPEEVKESASITMPPITPEEVSNFVIDLGQVEDVVSAMKKDGRRK